MNVAECKREEIRATKFAAIQELAGVLVKQCNRQTLECLLSEIAHAELNGLFNDHQVDLADVLYTSIRDRID